MIDAVFTLRVKCSDCPSNLSGDVSSVADIAAMPDRIAVGASLLRGQATRQGWTFLPDSNAYTVCRCKRCTADARKAVSRS